MRLLALMVAATLAACTPAGEAEERDAAARADPAANYVIPVEYRGRWAEMPAACLTDNSRRYEIGAITIDRQDFHAAVEAMEVSGDTVRLRLEAEGQALDFTLARIDENTIRASYTGRAPFTLLMCR